MKRLLCSLWIFSLILPVFSQITVDSGEDAIAIALQNSKNQIFQELKVKENMIKARLSVKDFLPRLGFSYSESDTVKNIWGEFYVLFGYSYPSVVQYR